MPKSKHSTPKEKPVELGFVEEQPDKWKLTSAFFASKLGGKPAWLNLKDIPNLNDVKCSSCDGPTRFLLQVYAPLDADDAFHRVIFIFVCTQQKCCVERNSNKNIVALRCQLPRKNDFYGFDPPNYEEKSAEDVLPEKFGKNTCRICGIVGPQHCGKCKQVHYCSKDHQTLDWKSGHKEECDDADFKANVSEEAKLAFPEMELVIDTEVIPKESKQDKSDKSRLDEYEKLVAEGKSGTIEDSAITKDMAEASSYKSDKVFNKFRKRVAYQPDQVLRYDRGGDPLWVSPDNAVEKKDVPQCTHCKGSRVFEFQIMPQLLNHLGSEAVEGSIDWGTIAVYTCEKGCVEDPAYKREFVWKQDFKPESKD